MAKRADSDTDFARSMAGGMSVVMHDITQCLIGAEVRTGAPGPVHHGQRTSANEERAWFARLHCSHTFRAICELLVDVSVARSAGTISKHTELRPADRVGM